MLDSVVECLVKRKMTNKAWLGRSFMIAGDILAVLIVFIICVYVPVVTFFALFIFLLFGFLTYFVFRNTDLEYEYSYFDGELVVDKIMNKKARKRCGKYDFNKMEVMAPVGSSHIRNGKGEYKVLDYTSHENTSTPYAAVVYSKENKLVELHFEPNEELMQRLNNQFSRKIFQD